MPAPKVAISREHLGTRASFAMQQQTQKTAAALNLFPLQPGVIVTGVACSVGPVITVVHGLGRVPKGWYPVRLYGYVSGTVALVEAGASPDKTTLSLGAQGSFTADIWVF